MGLDFYKVLSICFLDLDVAMCVCEAQEMYWRSSSAEESVLSLMCVGNPLKNPCLTILGKSGHLEIS